MTSNHSKDSTKLKDPLAGHSSPLSSLTSLESRLVYDAAGMLMTGVIDLPGTHIAPTPVIEYIHAIPDSQAETAALFENYIPPMLTPTIDPFVDKVVVFIEPTLNLNQIRDQIPIGAEIISLDPSKNGVAQMTWEIQQRHDIAQVLIIVPPTTNSLLIGNTRITESNIPIHQEMLASWRESLRPDARVILPTFNIEPDSTTSQFLIKLSSIVGIPIGPTPDLQAFSSSQEEKESFSKKH